ncbi:hypothetical protein C8R46DRAFT_1056066 [Mycena filopes]|nr:hypothetical protein C8R46DRAFT_1139684 [Mycena filopes]KAJ7188884.1 hypothetical protein C8R46DRAFT_1056066 [Mycena filopes]
MKSASTKSTRSSLQLRPQPLLPRRPTTSHYAERLTAASLAVHEPLNSWLINNIDSAGWIINFLYRTVNPSSPTEARCTVRVVHLKAPIDNGTIFKDPDVFLLWLFVDIPATSGVHCDQRKSPTALLARFEGFKDDADSPGWIHRMPPGERFRFTHDRAFLAALFCGKTSDIKLKQNVSAEMLTWACAAVVGTELEDTVLEYCANWRDTHRVLRHYTIVRAVRQVPWGKRAARRV